MQIEINGSDTSTLRVFQLDLPAEAVERFTVQAGTGEWPLKYALGATALRNGYVDVVDLRDLGQMHLSQYLTDAYGLSAAALKADKPRLDALHGHLVVLPAQAFDNTSQVLTIAPQLRLIGSYSDPASDQAGAKLHSTSAKGLLGQGASTGRKTGGSSLLKLIAIVIAVIALAAGVMMLR